jgi:hypothetical protein
MLAGAILGIRRRKSQDDKPTVGLAAMELLIATVGIILSAYSCSRVTGVIAHHHLVYLSICYASIFVSMISLKYPYQTNFLYFWAFNFIMFVINGVFMVAVLFSQYTFEGSKLAYGLAYYAYPAYIIACIVMNLKTLSSFKGGFG